ncbi:FG-GAP repeat domain-containing protein, partial [Flavobacterium sp.]
MNWNIYKIKTPTKFTISLVFLVIGFQFSYAQNTCATALPIATAGTFTITAIDGTNSLPACATGGALAEWYVYTPTQNHSVTVTSDLLVNICKDTHFNVYTGACGGLACYTSDDDSGTIACNSGNTNSYLSTKTFDAYAGTSYYIVWDNRWSAAGFQFQLTEAPLVPSPCSTATPITAGTTTVAAIDGTNVSTTCSTATLAKWYSYVPTQNYHVTVSSDLIANICKDTNFSVYTGSCSGTLTCVTSDDNSGIIACNSGNTDSFLSTKTFDVLAGTTYYIAWDNKWSTAGFNFQLTETPIIVPVTYTTQTIGTINSTYNLCIVDMNGDHKDDIVGVSANNLRVHYQTATPGTYTVADYPISGSSMMPGWSMAAGDYNRDGYNDLVLGSSNGLSVWSSNSTGTAYSNFTPGDYIFCQRTNFADLNNDGNLDVFSCHDIAPNCYYLNSGTSLSFYQSTVTPGAMEFGTIGGNYSTLFTDFDNDGDTDVFISKCSGPPCELHRNDGNGVYTDISAIAQINVTPIQTWSSGIADYDNDGDMDIIITASTGLHKYFRNNLDTSNNVEEAFTNITAGSGWDTNTATNIDNVAYDFDNDGFVDVMGGGSKIMFNQGNSTFSGVAYGGISVGAIGDLNNDGFLDIQSGSTIRYAVPNGNNWLTVALNGIQSNSNGIGTRIEIYGSWGKQIRDIRSGEGFKYM